MRKRAVFWICALFAVLIIGCSMLVYSLATEGFSQITPLGRNDIYRVNTDEQVPREDLSIFLVAEDRIFLYFDHAGIINVYTIDGEFLYGLQIKSLNNGNGDIGFCDGFLYVKARGGTLYVFDNSTLLESFNRGENPEAYERVNSLMDGEPCHQSYAETYYVSNNKVLSISEDGSIRTVIRLPQINEDVRYLGIFILLTISGLSYYLLHQKRVGNVS